MQEEQETDWELEDVRDLAEAAPYTFYMPSSEVIAMLQPGDEVRLVFRLEQEEDKDGEQGQAWLRILEINGDDFLGELVNLSQDFIDLELGDQIDFTSYHIVETKLDDPVPNIVQQYTQGCYVTSRVLDDEQPVGALYRENPDEAEEVIPGFSGWNIMAGDEDDDYLDDPENWYYVSLATVLNIDDRFIDVLDAPYDSEFEYDPEQDSFVEIEEDED